MSLPTTADYLPRTISFPCTLQFDARGTDSDAKQAALVMEIVNATLARSGITCEPAILPAETLASLFSTMPTPPDDMGSLEGLEAYAEAIAQWRADHGFPLRYGGPVGPKPLLQWWRVRCSVVCDGRTMEEGIVYSRAATTQEAAALAREHVHETWPTANDRLDYRVDTDNPEWQDECDARFNRPESVFTEGN